MFQTEQYTKEIEKIQEETSDAFAAFRGLSFDDAQTKLAGNLVDFAFKLAIAIFVFYVGKFIIRRIFRTVYTIMINKKVDASLTTFVLSLIKMVLYFILIITIIGILGIETSSFLALFASAGVAIGMALSGTLQNFAGGVLILLLKPYKVGDFIEVQGYTGKVKAIQIFHTIINTTDNKAIIIPNGGLSTSSVNNYSLESYRRVDWTISLAYGTDLQKALDTLLSMVKSDSRVVEKYLEDDRQKRRLEENAHSALEDKCENDPYAAGCEKRKTRVSWWQRFKASRIRHNEQVQHRLDEQISANAGLPVKADCSPFAGLDNMADSSINIVVRAWTQSKDYWDLYYEMNRRFYTELPALGFSFPYPQMDVHINGSIDSVSINDKTDVE